jgi:hypothetical protein
LDFNDYPKLWPFDLIGKDDEKRPLKASDKETNVPEGIYMT